MNSEDFVLTFQPRMQKEDEEFNDDSSVERTENNLSLDECNSDLDIANEQVSDLLHEI